MRSLLFRHELKMKRIKKVKSKVYHRMMKKDRLKASSHEMLMDPEAAKEQAMKQEFKRAEVINDLDNILRAECILKINCLSRFLILKILGTRNLFLNLLFF